MDLRRRNFLQAGAVLSFAVMSGVLTLEEARAAETQWNKELFEATDNEGVFKALGASSPEKSDKVKLVAPDIAENGAVVPIALSSDMENHQGEDGQDVGYFRLGQGWRQILFGAERSQGDAGRLRRLITVGFQFFRTLNGSGKWQRDQCVFARKKRTG